MSELGNDCITHCIICGDTLSAEYNFACDSPCWNVVDTYRQEIDKFNSVKGVKYNKRVLFNMFKRSGLTYDEALIIHTLGALDD
jgi:hypothetical protein